MKLGYELTIEQTQKLVMTPELIQAIQILQFNTQELECFVEEQLLANPVLEKTDKSDSEEAQSEESTPAEETTYEELEATEYDWAEHFKEREYDDISYKQDHFSQDNPVFSYDRFLTSDTTLADHLLMQLEFVSMKPNCKEVARYLIEALDENGYLTSSVEEVASIFGIDAEKVVRVLKIIQGFEPQGIGARNLKECLQIQMMQLGENSPKICEIIQNHLEDLASNRLSTIAKAVGLTILEVQEISDIIKHLEPKPGRQYGSVNDNRYIVPDVNVEKMDGEYIITVNDSTAPRLNISYYYQKMLKEAEKDSNISKFLSSRLNSAVWLIKSIEQRRQTIHNVVQAVVRYQVEFFEYGSKHLKTLTLKQIAEEVGIHESTVSRSINGKYMQTPRGVFEIKYFFTSGVAGSDGLGIASESIKTFIREIVEKEDPKSPLSDQAIVLMLKKRGIDISRRTIAKYRDEMSLPSSSKRKRYL